MCQSVERKKRLFYQIIFLSLSEVLAINKDVVEYSRPSDCKQTEYFDVISFSCIECNPKKNLEPSVDRLRCVCNKLSKTIGFRNGYPLCTLCGPNAVVTADGGACIACEKGTCKCSSNEIQIDRDINGTLLSHAYCLSCPVDTYPSYDGLRCLPCSNISHTFHVNCPCPPVSHIRVQNYCLHKDDLSDWLDVRSTYLIKFNKQHIDSFYFRTELQAAMYFCKKKDRLACEHLSNMCALTLYDNGVPCMLFMQTHISPTWLLYNEEERAAVLDNKQITENYSLRKHDNNTIINFTIASFSMEGRLQSIGSPNMPCNFLKHVRFGVNIHKKCKLTTEDLRKKEIQFFSPYLTFNKNGKLLMQALPVLIKKSDESIDEISQWKLMRKFFLVDNISGFKALPSSTHGRFIKDKNLSILRYMKSLNVLISVQNKEKRGKIYVPLLIVEYEDITEADFLDGREIFIDYKITFTLKNRDINYDLQVLIGVFSGIAIIYSGIKTWSHCQRSHNCTLNFTVLIWFIVYTMGTVGSVITLTLVSSGIYIFIFYKGQTAPYILLPDVKSERDMQIYMTIAFSFKVVEIIGFMYRQWNMDIFLIDWEQPRKMPNEFKYDSPHTSLRKLYSARFTDKNPISPRTPSEIITAKRKQNILRSQRNSSPSQHSKSPETDKRETDSTVCSISKSFMQATGDFNYSCNFPVSIWRTYFVANEWLKLQTRRRTNILFQTIFTLSILEVIGLHFWTAAIPELTLDSDFSKENKNLTLYFAVCSLIYSSIYSVQWILAVGFYERYMKNYIEIFIDLCSITNISVFILPFNYYGFYIHGRSVHGYADTDMPTLINDLKDEQSNLCAHRGLVPGTTDQTFIVSLTERFKTFYNNLHKRTNHGTKKFLRMRSSPNTEWDQVLDIRSKVKRFLSEFIDHSFKDEDYIIKEQHFLEKLLDITYINPNEKSIFYIDTSYCFDKVTFYGNEWLLATFEITVFAFAIVIYKECIFACIIVIIMSKSILMIAKCFNKWNFGNKSLLDKRFLM